MERVLRYWTVRDKFNGVEETLANIGVKRVEVTPEGLLFVMDENSVDSNESDPIKEELSMFKRRKVEK